MPMPRPVLVADAKDATRTAAPRKAAVKKVPSPAPKTTTAKPAPRKTTPKSTPAKTATPKRRAVMANSPIDDIDPKVLMAAFTAARAAAQQEAQDKKDAQTTAHINAIVAAMLQDPEATPAAPVADPAAPVDPAAVAASAAPVAPVAPAAPVAPPVVVDASAPVAPVTPPVTEAVTPVRGSVTSTFKNSFEERSGLSSTTVVAAIAIAVIVVIICWVNLQSIEVSLYGGSHQGFGPLFLIAIGAMVLGLGLVIATMIGRTHLESSSSTTTSTNSAPADVPATPDTSPTRVIV